MAHSVSCKQVTDRSTARHRRTEGDARFSAVLTADVTYTATPPDPSFIETRTAVPQNRAELDQMPAVPAPIDPTAATPVRLEHCPCTSSPAIHSGRG